MKKQLGQGIFMAMGGIDPRLLEKAEKMEGNPVKKVQKRPNIWGAVACCVLLFGAGSETVRHFITGSSYRWNEAGQSQFSGKDMSHKVYREGENGLEYLYQPMNITKFCSATDYVMDFSLDQHGTGYVMVVGGEAGRRGYYVFYYEGGEFFLGEGIAEPYTLLEMTDPSIVAGEVDSAYPHLIWNHHATHFLGLHLPESLYGGDLPDFVETELGTAEKIGETMYHVSGWDFGEYTEWEMGEYVMFSIEDRIETPKGMEWSYFADENLFLVHLYSPWSAELEEIAVEILEDFGYPYELKFMD